MSKFFRYINFCTRSRAIGLVGGCWFLSILFVVFAWFSNSFRCVDEDCVTLAIFPNRLHIYLPFVIFVGIIPTLTSLIVALYILRIVGKHRKQINKGNFFLTITVKLAKGREEKRKVKEKKRRFYLKVREIESIRV